MLPTRLVDGTLEITLPHALGVADRDTLIRTVEAGLESPVRRLQLNAKALRDVDTAALGAFARISRMCIDETGTYPLLVDAHDDLKDALRSVLLLKHFEVRDGK